MRYLRSEDQEFFRATTARFLTELVPPAELRARRDDPTGFDLDYWRRGAELGWTSLLVDEAHGGGSISDAGLVDLSVIAYEFGAHAAPGPLVPGNVVAAALSAAGSHLEVLAAVMSGTSIAAWCDGCESPDPTSVSSINVRRERDEIVISGMVRPVESAAAADHLLVAGRSGDAVTQVIVPIDTPGVALTPMSSVDLTRRFSLVRFDEVRLPASAVVGQYGAAGEALLWQRRLAIVVAAAESVGTMQTAFDMTVEWAFDRYSFGRPLASYQALKHRFADMKTWLEASHAIADSAAAAMSSGDPNAAELVHAAMAFIGHYGSELLQDCVQMHGGLGVTFEHDVHLYLRRHTLNRTLWGGPTVHRQMITDLVEARELVGA